MSLYKTLIEMGYSPEDAKAEMEEARYMINSYLEQDDMEGAENICQEMWGLEPDFLVELI